MTWLRWLEHIDRLEHPARVGSWLAATARDECLRAVAARKEIVLVHSIGSTHRRCLARLRVLLQAS